MMKTSKKNLKLWKQIMETVKTEARSLTNVLAWRLFFR